MADDRSVYKWRRSLRSRSPSPTRISDLNSSKGAFMTDPPLKSSPSILRKSVNSSCNQYVRKSTGSMSPALHLVGKSLKDCAELNTIEAEYIKNLQQQIYFLELEANYLRDQANKASEKHPKMTAEAERMLAKLKIMQNEMCELQFELKQRDAAVEMTLSEKEQLAEKLQEESESRLREKRLWTEEMVQLKKEKDRLERDVMRKDAQLIEAKSEIDKSAVALSNAEMRITSLKREVDDTMAQAQISQIALEEKQQSLLSLSQKDSSQKNLSHKELSQKELSQLSQKELSQKELSQKELSQKEFSQESFAAAEQEKVCQELRDEICLLRQKLKEMELSVEKEQFLQDKSVEETAHLVRENALLSQQVAEYARQHDREVVIRETHEKRTSESEIEMTSLRDQLNLVQLEVDQLNERSRREQQKTQQYLEQMTQHEVAKNTSELQLNSTKMRLSELEESTVAAETDNAQLRKDKMLLVDHVADLQAKLDEKDREILRVKHTLHSLENRLQDSNYQATVEHSLQSQKWEEFGRLAESMRTLSHSMAAQATSSLPPSNIMQY